MKRALIEDVVNFDKASDANLPKLVTFASGDNVPAGAKFTHFRNTDDGSLVLAADTKRMSYVNKSQPEQLMLAVVNKTTGKARLVPLQSYHLCPALQPALPEPAAADTARPTWEDVGKTFGLARWQKMHTRSKRLAVGSGTRSVADSLSAASQLVEEGDPRAAAEEVPAEAGLVPPQDGGANEAAGVYQREDVVPAAVWGRLQGSVENFEAALTKHASTHEYIVRQADAWRECDEDRFTLTMYAFYLLRLLRYLQDMKVKKSWKQLMVPPPVLEHMRVTFMERSHDGWDRSDRLVDKLVCYLMVVTLWIHDYTINLNDIAGATRIQVKKLLQYASLLGLTVSGQRAALRLPLKLKATTNARRTKKVAAM